MDLRASRTGFAMLVAAGLATSCAPYSRMGGTTYLGFSVGVAHAPPPPALRVSGSSAFSVSVSEGVYSVPDPGADCDVFSYDSRYYLYYGGYWYESPSGDGPYRVIDVHRVPGPVLRVPPERWRHHPMARREERERDRDERRHD